MSHPSDPPERPETENDTFPESEDPNRQRAAMAGGSTGGTAVAPPPRGKSGWHGLALALAAVFVIALVLYALT